jgi:hypothetical protein
MRNIEKTLTTENIKRSNFPSFSILQKRIKIKTDRHKIAVLE